MIAIEPRDSLLPVEAWQELRRWYQENGRHGLPWRSQRTPWRVLIAETLLHRTRADIASRLYRALADEFPSPLSVFEHGDRWRTMIAPAGLAWRAEAFISCCRHLAEHFQDSVPQDRGQLERLPGIGHYVAEAVRCFGFDVPAVLADTNTIRLAARVSGCDASPTHHRSQAVQNLVRRMGEGGSPCCADDNFALLDLAALVCLPRQPRCESCPVVSWCASRRAGQPKRHLVEWTALPRTAAAAAVG